MVWDEFWTDRGSPWEYDPGPPRNRKWPRLFAETPNYRGIGKAVTGRDAFRWHFGPMFYRGRLRDNRVKVLIVGQEGAQDESLTHRSFTGGTGARMQHLLNHLGVNYSYLFLNTFVYPIFGQYHDDLRTLAQDPGSPICRHRNEILDYVVARNDVHLAIAVGTAAKESLATWVESHGGNADPRRLHLADGDAISPKLKMVGVLHPGGAVRGGARSAIIADFKSAIGRVERWSRDDPHWLPVDQGATRQRARDYEYRSAPIPFRDFPYGTAWRLGRGGTSSNRRDSQTAIQIFSKDGKYNARGHRLSYSGSPAGSDQGYRDEPGDLPYEPPRRSYRDFDSGPGRRFARLLQGGDPNFPWPDFADLGLSSHPSFGYGPVYRGCPEDASLLVLADQQSHDDLFTGRALTGDAGQDLQAFLRAAGLTSRYAILRVLPIDTLTENSSEVRAAVDHPATRALYAEAVRRVDPAVLVAAGPNSRRLVGHANPNGRPVVEMLARSQRGSTRSWNDALDALRPLRYGKDLARPSFDYRGDREQIPRSDLPFGTLRWQASSGDRGLQPKRGRRASFDYYKLVMPRWASRLHPEPLSRSEQQAVDRL